MSRLTRGPPFSGAAVDFMGRRMATLLGSLMRWVEKTTQPSARRKAGERSRYGLSIEGRGKSIGAYANSVIPQSWGDGEAGPKGGGCAGGGGEGCGDELRRLGLPRRLSVTSECSNTNRSVHGEAGNDSGNPSGATPTARG